MIRQNLYIVWLDDDDDGFVDTNRDAPVPQWLVSNVGDRGVDWNYHEEPRGAYFEFYTEDNAVLFHVRWNGCIKGLQQ